MNSLQMGILISVLLVTAVSMILLASRIGLSEVDAVRSNTLNITVTEDLSRQFQELVDCLIENGMGKVWANVTNDEINRLLEEHAAMLQECRERWLQDGTPTTISIHMVSPDSTSVFKFGNNSTLLELAVIGVWGKIGDNLIEPQIDPVVNVSWFTSEGRLVHSKLATVQGDQYAFIAKSGVYRASFVLVNGLNNTALIPGNWTVRAEYQMPEKSVHAETTFEVRFEDEGQDPITITTDSSKYVINPANPTPTVTGKGKIIEPVYNYRIDEPVSLDLFFPDGSLFVSSRLYPDWVAHTLEYQVVSGSIDNEGTFGFTIDINENIARDKERVGKWKINASYGNISIDNSTARAFTSTTFDLVSSSCDPAEFPQESRISLKTLDGRETSAIAIGQQIVVEIDNSRPPSDSKQTVENICLQVLEVRNNDDITEFLTWQTFDSNGQVGLSWIPEKSGVYQLRTFTLDNIDNPKIMTPVGVLLIQVSE